MLYPVKVQSMKHPHNKFLATVLSAARKVWILQRCFFSINIFSGPTFTYDTSEDR